MKWYILLLFFPVILLAKIGTVAALSGDASILRNAANIVIENGSGIELKDLLITQDNSKVQVIMRDQTIITIGENSEYSFDEYTFEEGEDPKAFMRLKRGFFRAITGKIGKIAPKRFKIETKSATIGIRGTHFFGMIKEDEEKIGCLRGTIIVYTQLDDYVLSAGEMIVFRNGKWKKKTISKDLNIDLKKVSKSLNEQNMMIQKAQSLSVNPSTGIIPDGIPHFDPDR
ncbi:MAG: hypothetical protein DRG24_07970 [Epsilonproteobacteria bacterium]|nr:MAG: hypothetical protein DRG24_07970 [Campylobacterota bacterium]